MNETRTWFKLIILVAVLNFLYELSSFRIVYSPVRIMLYSIAIILSILIFVIRNKSVINNKIDYSEFKKIVTRYMIVLIIPLTIIINVVYIIMIKSFYNNSVELYNFMNFLNMNVLINFVIVAVIAMLYNLSTNKEASLTIIIKIVCSVLVSTMIFNLLDIIISQAFNAWVVETVTLVNYKYYALINMFIMNILLMVKLSIIALINKNIICWGSNNKSNNIDFKDNNELFNAN